MKEKQLIKVAIFMPLAEQRGGGEMMLIHLMQQGLGNGVDWLVVFFEAGPMVDQLQAMGVDAIVVETGRLRQTGRYLIAVAALARLMRERQVDIIVGWMAMAHIYGWPTGLLSRTPSLWYQLGVSSRWSWLDRLASALPSLGVITLSKAGEKAQLAITPGGRTRLVYPGVELDRFDPSKLPMPAEARRRLGLPETGPLIGIVGRLQRWKGIHVLIEAMPEVLRHYSDAHAVVVGGGHDLEPDYPALLNQRIADLNLEDRLILAGIQRNIPEWIQAFDIFVHASDNEPFGIVIIEAMALGKPVIAGDSGGPTEIIEGGKHGLLTPYGDAPALATAIKTLLDDPKLAKEIGEAGQARAQDFSTQKYAQKFIAALSSLRDEKA